ncbi:hypothetical protein EYF80_011492 [Liparis tanakae]|uniref:DUF4549 domain-containing protein n=1 Tax=Liparis tanakae TaxID=230148 RepID=A0A4Z2IM24_9TELE|nr:hypothetical protein EYF80_011492 [Liparis tanakae]
MRDAYRVSSSARVQQMEAEMSRQLAALREEVEENGSPQGASRCYRCGRCGCDVVLVLVLPDVSFFRLEREHALRRGLQVAEALPLESQADVMQRELESCLSLEYTPDSLPPLLHQFYTDRSYQLAHTKYLLMLRWRRFCRHSRFTGVPGVPGVPAAGVPLHAAHLEEFLLELQELLAHFQLSYDARELQTSADEMELFSVVWREFRTIFGQQEQMKTFPQYDGSEVKGQWGRKSGRTALRKEADWIPFIQVKPTRDPWQQKFVTKLKEKKSIDELLKMSSSLLQVSDLMHVTAALKDHAAHDGGVRSAATSSPTSSASSGSEAKRRKISELWTSVYGAAPLTQAREGTDRVNGARGHKKKSPTSNTEDESCSLEDRLQLLGLDDSSEEGTSDPIVTRGAYLSLIHLRHLKLRELQRVALGLLNYLRSVERTLTFDLAGLQLEDGELCATAEEPGWMNAARGGRGEAGGLGSPQHSHNTPVDCKVRCSEFMEFAEVENLHDFYSAEGRLVHAQDQRGLFVVYDAALGDLRELEEELLLVGSRFLQRDGARRRSRSSSSAAGPHADRAAVLLDLWTCETDFLESKVQVMKMKMDTVFICCPRLFVGSYDDVTERYLLNCYYEAYQHAAGAEERFALARVITDITHSRPQLDPSQGGFVEAYAATSGCLRSHGRLVRDILDNQIENQRRYLQHIWRDDRKGSAHDFGIPPKHVPKHLVSLGGGGLYRNAASELGFAGFHLHLRPVTFEAAEQRPVVTTATLEDDATLDRFTPPHLPLSIQEVDEDDIGRFSFSSQEAVAQLVSAPRIENLQVTLACQLVQKNALMSAVTLLCVCHAAESESRQPPAWSEAACHSAKDVQLDSEPGSDVNNLQDGSNFSPSARTPASSRERFSVRMSLHAVRTQVVSYGLRLSGLLEDVPSAQLDQYRRRMQQDVSEMVTRVRVEGVARIMKLRKKLGSTDDGGVLAQLKKGEEDEEEEVHALRRENRRLSALLCQQKALSRWRQAVDHEKIHRQLLETQQVREIACRSDALGVKMRSEEEVMILQEQLEAARKALSCSRAECSGTKTLLGRKAEQLQLARHQSAQEARGRRELDGCRAQSLDRMRAAVEDGERRLRGLSGQLDRGSRMSRLHRQRSAREMRQVRSQLQQELGLKREAFQQVNRLQDQVTDLGAAATAGLHRAGRQQPGLTSSAGLQDSAAEPARSRSHARMDRAKAEPSRLREPTAPDRTDSS